MAVLLSLLCILHPPRCEIALDGRGKGAGVGYSFAFGVTEKMQDILKVARRPRIEDQHCHSHIFHRLPGTIIQALQYCIQ